MAIDIKKFYGRFIDEAREHLEKINQGLLQLNQANNDVELVNAIFRSAHTIKGSSRMLKLEPIAETTHKLEDVLCALRDGTIRFNPLLSKTLFKVIDALSAQVEHFATSLDPNSLTPADQNLCAELDVAAQGSPQPEQAPAAPAPATETVGPTTHANLQFKTTDSVRVRLSNVDSIVKLMGEVFSSHARLQQRLLELRSLDESVRCRIRPFIQALKDDLLSQESLMNELHDQALVMRMLPLSMLFQPAGRMLRELAQSIGKQVECSISGDDIALDRHLIDKLGDPLVHLLRNAVDHGLESPDVRLVAGKPAQGLIRLNAWQEGSWILIEVSDDGAGIALDKVRAKAIEKGLVSANNLANMGEQETLELIFLPGFSTSANITDLSGRGVGMDVVKQCVVNDMQGTVNISSRVGCGCTITLRLPVSLAVSRGLLVEESGLSFFFIVQHVAEVLRVPQESYIKVAGGNAVIIRNEFIPVLSLTRLLQTPGAAQTQALSPRGLLTIVIQVNNEKLALIVDQVLNESDIIIKPLPPHLRKAVCVSGIVFTGKNELVSVLNAPNLLEIARKLRVHPLRTRVEASSETHKIPQTERHILVVDDSLNTREIEKDVLETLGYQVTLAENGQDGLNKALAGHFDAILTDVEMPVMDGFTLTTQLRRQQKYRTCPIVMVTSREKAEDKRRGMEAGADAYIVKGDFDMGNMVKTLKALLG